MSACTKHAAEPVRGYSDCPGCEVESLRQQLAAAQAEVRELQRVQSEVLANLDAPDDMDVISAAHFVAGSLSTAEEALEAAQSEARNWKRIAEDALSQPAEQHDPLAVSDHCGECGEPEPECACDERESLPLMARREWRESAAFATVNQGAITGVFDRYDAAARSATHHRACIYRIADTDEHGLPVIERTADMPKRAKYRLSWITQAGDVDYTDILPLALEANRSGAVSERIEDYRPAAQESE